VHRSVREEERERRRRVKTEENRVDEY